MFYGTDIWPLIHTYASGILFLGYIPIWLFLDLICWSRPDRMCWLNSREWFNVKTIFRCSCHLSAELLRPPLHSSSSESTPRHIQIFSHSLHTLPTQPPAALSWGAGSYINHSFTSPLKMMSRWANRQDSYLSSLLCASWVLNLL